ncbi:MAG: Stp1/IreP family PP2C-type Ser/Thr phosphatase [Christensenellales bacterium]|jgi:serine/threonine protein phosphatase PrpC
MIYYAKSRKGKAREINEDCFYAPAGHKGFFAVVADGMGGHNAGEVASKIVVDTVVEELSAAKPVDISKEEMKLILSLANKSVWEDSILHSQRKGMGSTATVAVFCGNQVIIGHVGDSRAYLFKDGMLSQITKDHSYVQLMIDNGSLSKDEAIHHPYKNIITRVIGTQLNVDVDIYNVTLNRDDCILMCTDGLNAAVMDEEIADILKKGIDLSAEKLVETAVIQGSTDDITVVVAHMEEDLI